MSKTRPFHLRGKLTSRKGSKVFLKAPKDVRDAGGGGFNGVIIDEVWATPETNDSPCRPACAGDWGDYSFCAQLIRSVEDGSEKFNIRLAYYRRRAGEDAWQFASQMTVMCEPKLMKVLLDRTLAKKEWFQQISEETTDMSYSDLK